MINFLLSLSRASKRIVSICFDTIFIFVCFWSALIIRLDTSRPIYEIENWWLLAITIVSTIFIFARLGLYRAILRYLTFHAVGIIALGVLGSAVVLTVVSFYTQASFPRTVPLIYGAFLFIFCAGTRLLARRLFAESSSFKSQRALIYGAGASGRQLATAIRFSREFKPVGFVDDNKTLVGSLMMGLKIHSPEKIELLINMYRVDKILIAMPSLNATARRKLLEKIIKLPVDVLTIPGMADIVSGKAKIDEFKDVAIDDLLGRDSVQPDKFLLETNIKDKSVMVTGAGGSIGSELCRQIFNNKPKQLILFEQSEYALYKIHQELTLNLNNVDFKINIIPLLGDVKNEKHLIDVMNNNQVDAVYHAAAYKHVPLVEENIIAAVENNIFGTHATAQAAIEAKVKTFVLISTDKAVRPTNVMGATKRMAELTLQGLAKLGYSTNFCMVRFGNVLGSSGSVIPLFKEQIKSGGPITVTHPDITRYFMTIPEASQLVIQAAAMHQAGGRVYVLDMGQPVNITNLAKNLIHLSGRTLKDDANENGDIEIIYTGLRPGEKLYEELLIGDNVRDTSHKQIKAADELSLEWQEVVSILHELKQSCDIHDGAKAKTILSEAPTLFDSGNTNSSNVIPFNL